MTNVKKCPSCGVEKPWDDFYLEAKRQRPGNYCKPCIKKSVDERRKRLGLKSTEQVRAWRLAHSDAKERRHPGDVRYRTENAEKCKKATRDCMARNPTYYRAKTAAYRERHPDKFVSYFHNRRARMLNVGGEHTADQVKELLTKQRSRCAYCKTKLVDRKYHRDHIVPVCRGGSNDICNIQLLCPRCNTKKNGVDPIDFANRLGLLL